MPGDCPLTGWPPRDVPLHGGIRTRPCLPGAPAGLGAGLRRSVGSSGDPAGAEGCAVACPAWGSEGRWCTAGTRRVSRCSVCRRTLPEDVNIFPQILSCFHYLHFVLNRKLFYISVHPEHLSQPPSEMCVSKWWFLELIWTSTENTLELRCFSFPIVGSRWEASGDPWGGLFSLYFKGKSHLS